MIIWINGAFGSGKTQTAYALHRRLPGSFVFDPENAGYYLRKNEPLSMQRENFQDERLWRLFNLEMLKAIALDYDGVILVPMTIINSAYYAEIIGGLRNAGIAVKHFVLWANQRTLKKRLRKRLEGKRSWAARQIDSCLAAFSNPLFENRIDTEQLTITQTAEYIADFCGLTLQKRPPFIKAKFLAFFTQLRHIR